MNNSILVHVADRDCEFSEDPASFDFWQTSSFDEIVEQLPAAAELGN